LGGLFSQHDADIFLGPAEEGWNLFEHCEIRLAPINYDPVRNAGVVKSNGFSKSGERPMWLEPRTEDLLKQLHDRAT